MSEKWLSKMQMSAAFFVVDELRFLWYSLFMLNEKGDWTMFVDIKNFKSAIGVENILTPYKKGRLADDKKTRLPKEPITPEVCLEVLQSTNYARNIKDMLLCIAELPPAEQGKFKEIVLAAFDNREQPNDIVVLGKKLAVANGFEHELSKAEKLNEGDFLLSSPKLSRGVMTRETNLSDMDLAPYDKLIAYARDLCFSRDKKLPEMLEFPNAEQVDLSWCDMAGVRKIVANDKAKIYLDSSWNLEPHIEFGACKEILMSNYDKKQFEQWKYPANALTFYSYEDVKGEVDLSPFHKVDMQVVNCKDVTDIRFAEGALVKMSGVVNLPKKVDFSPCAEVVLNDCDLSTVEQIIFKNRAQMPQKDLRLADTCKVIFADEQKSVDLVRLKAMVEMKTKA